MARTTQVKAPSTRSRTTPSNKPASRSGKTPTKTSTKAPPRKNIQQSKARSVKAKAVSVPLDTSTAEALAAAPAEQLWREFGRTRSVEIRNFFLVKYLDLVRATAERMHMRLPNEVDVDDLMSVGSFGLMDAIDGFDIERGVKFETYCAQRIRGAIFDELRSMDWVPRLVRSRTAKVERARRALEMRSGYKPTDEEVSNHLGVNNTEFKKLSKDSRPVGVVSLTRKWFETDSNKDVREIDVIHDQRQPNPLRSVQQRDLKTLMTKGLSRAERLIVILYYYEEMTMKEIGATLDLSESRVSQMHSSILARLKAQMQHRAKEL
ncbi:MAG: FliA/WhiG family RNA polymerase sigma factor [Phycisphaerales bacterium]